MDALVVLVLKVVGAAGGVALFVYVLYRLVLAARKIGRTEAGAQIVGIFVMLFGPNIAPPPSREVVTESREQNESGDPPSPTVVRLRMHQSPPPHNDRKFSDRPFMAEVAP
jgi:hypothetical protein